MPTHENASNPVQDRIEKFVKEWQPYVVYGVQFRNQGIVTNIFRQSVATLVLELMEQDHDLDMMENTVRSLTKIDDPIPDEEDPPMFGGKKRNKPTK